jgi:EmrB/QacA subfamily drug resistance transporter
MTLPAPASSSAFPPRERIDYASSLSPRTKAFVLAGVMMGLFLAALDQTIIAAALPRIVADLQGMDLYAWTSTSYLLASTTMVPIYGKLSDSVGRKQVLLAGIAIFLLGSVLCGFARSMLALVLFRGVQGLGAAAITSTAFAVPADLFEPAERARYQGIFGTVFALASVVGPVLGGALTDTVGWRWVFFINLPLGAIAVAFIFAHMPRLHSGLTSKVDWLGALLLVLATVPLLLTLRADRPLDAWLSPSVLGMLALSLVSLVLFIAVERKNPDAIIPFALFDNRVFVLLCLTSVCTGAGFFSALLFLSAFAVNALGATAREAGMAMIPLTFAIVLTSFLSARIVSRTGRYKAVVVGALTLVCLGLFLLTTLTPESSLRGIAVRTFILGCGIGPALPLLTLAIQNAVPFNQVGTATSGRQFFQQLGQAIGGAVFGLVLTSSLSHALTDTLGPVRAEVPATMRAQFDRWFDPSRLRNGGVAQERAGGDARSTFDRIADEVRAEYGALRRAPGADADQIARDETQALAHARAGDRAVRLSFARAVTRVYEWSLPVVLCGLILVLFTRELPLGKSNPKTGPHRQH